MNIKKEKMEKNKIEKKEYRKKIIDVAEGLSIWTDGRQYIVFGAGSPWYLPSLTSCYWEIYEHILKINLSEQVRKDITEIKEIYKKTKDQISKILDIDKN